MVVQLVELLVESALEFVHCAIQSLIHVATVMCHDGRRAPLYTGLHGAALVIPAALVPVFVAEMNLNPSNARGKSAQHPRHDFLHVRYYFLSTVDVLVRIDLDLHIRHLVAEHRAGAGRFAPSCGHSALPSEKPATRCNANRSVPTYFGGGVSFEPDREDGLEPRNTLVLLFPLMSLA